jgi:hypothetical protein
MWNVLELRGADVINALGRYLRQEWSVDAIGPSPDAIARLVSQLEETERDALPIQDGNAS